MSRWSSAAAGTWHVLQECARHVVALVLAELQEEVRILLKLIKVEVSYRDAVLAVLLNNFYVCFEKLECFLSHLLHVVEKEGDLRLLQLQSQVLVIYMLTHELNKHVAFLEVELTVVIVLDY